MSDSEQNAATAYRGRYCAIAKKIYQLGGSKEDLAKALGTSPNIIGDWERLYPAFAQASEAGRQAADDRVEKALFALCTGYSVEVEEIRAYRGRPCRIRQTKWIPSDPAACQFMLTNLDRRHWKMPKEVPYHQPDDEISRWFKETKFTIFQPVEDPPDD